MESKNGEEHCGDFEDFCSDGDAALAKTISQKPTGHRKEEERHCEQVPDHEDAEIFLRRGGVLSEDYKNDKELQAIVVERALKLRCNQAPETAPPTRWCCEHVFWHNASPEHAAQCLTNVKRV